MLIFQAWVTCAIRQGENRPSRTEQLQHNRNFRHPSYSRRNKPRSCLCVHWRRLPLRHVLLARFPRVVLLGWDDPLIQRHFQRLRTGKLTGVDPGTPRNSQRRKVEVTEWPKQTDKIDNSSQQWIQEERQKQHSNHHGGLLMTEQFKLVTNAQESKIFKVT